MELLAQAAFEKRSQQRRRDKRSQDADRDDDRYQPDGDFPGARVAREVRGAAPEFVSAKCHNDLTGRVVGTIGIYRARSRLSSDERTEPAE
jgi:hypothetical protein